MNQLEKDYAKSDAPRAPMASYTPAAKREPKRPIQATKQRLWALDLLGFVFAVLALIAVLSAFEVI